MSSDPWDVREADFPARAPLPEQLRFLVRYAVLAPSFRNLQPWRFEVDGNRVGVYADRSRRALTADAHRRDLFVSVGCAIENLLLAAQRFGLRSELDYFPLSEDDDLVAQIRFESGTAPEKPNPLFRAIVRRRTHHGKYDGRALGPTALGRLQDCCDEPDLFLFLTQDRPIKEAVEKLVLRASEAVFGNPLYRREQAEAMQEGAFGADGASLPLLRSAMAHFGLAEEPAQHDYQVLATSPVFGLISASKGGREAQVKAGRVLERLYLCATTLALSIQPLSVLLEADEAAAAFGRLFRAGGVALLPFRLGYAAHPEKAAPRRPLQDVLS